MVGYPAQEAAGAHRGRPMTYTKLCPRNGSPILPGFILNIHPMYIPFKLVDNKMGKEIPAKYVQLFLNSDDPYTYGKMSANGPTFVSKILATLLQLDPC